MTIAATAAPTFPAQAFTASAAERAHAPDAWAFANSDTDTSRIPVSTSPSHVQNTRWGIQMRQPYSGRRYSGASWGIPHRAC